MTAWLEQAAQSAGKNRPVLAVGRDGITLATRPHGFFEVATVATLTVYDRSRNRLGSVYLGQTPELGQATLECGYYQHVLRTLRHPTTGEPLAWTRILDYYHASQRLTTIAAALLGADTREARSWAAKDAEGLEAAERRVPRAALGGRLGGAARVVGETGGKNISALTTICALARGTYAITTIGGWACPSAAA